MEKTEEKIKNKRMTEWILFGIYAFLLILVSCFHEPWHDEAEAWQMSKASIKDILFYIPHYEGHPALWYLILSIPSKLGVPYEIGLKTIACGAALVYGWLMLFKSPFPKILRYSLPFHYFLFYQYGVLSRPYGLMVICFFLMAMTFREKNEKPFRFLLPMAVACGLSGYGIVLSGGICMVWVWEICREKHWKFFTKSFWKDKRILGLALLLALAVLITLEIMPRPDTYALTRTARNTLPLRLIYTIFMMLPDSTAITVLEGAAFLNMAMISVPVIIVGVVIGICLLTAITMFASRKSLPYFFVPYLLFTIFSAYVYFCAHHMGLILIFTIFWLWITLEDPEKIWLGGKCWKKIKLAESDRKTVRNAGKIGLAILILIPFYWTAGASYLEITEPFYYSRDLAKFLKENGLDQLKIMGGFDVSIPALYDLDEDLMQYVNTELVSRPVSVVPYFKHNICMNLNMGRDDAGYSLHRVPSAEENREVIKAWREMGLPDVIIDEEGMFMIMGDAVFESQYAIIYQYPPYPNVWKAFLSKYNVAYPGYVYMRKDLLEQYGLRDIMEN